MYISNSDKIILTFHFLFFVVAFISLPLSCAAKTEGIGESKWGILSGCMVKPPGKDYFVPLENYREI